MVISDDDESGVMAVALVDKPAIMVNWMAFAEQRKHLFKTTNEEKRIISGALMVADQPIYRRDAELGEYNVVFEAETISKIIQKFFRQGNTSNVNMMHSESLKANGVYMIESFQINKERGINTPKGFDELADGSWFGSFKVDNEQIWQDFIKTGVFKGFSVEGYFKPKEEVEFTEADFKKAAEFIKTVHL